MIDSDLGQSGAAAAHGKRFKDLVARVTLGEVGLILSMDVTRLARNCSDWYPLLDVCGPSPLFDGPPCACFGNSRTAISVIRGQRFQ
nr:hypothetical protein [Bradyrhizobium hereditatis]